MAQMKQGQTVAEAMVEFALSLRYEDIPTHVRSAAKLHLLDTIGCGLAAHALGRGTAVRRTMAEMGGEGQAAVIGLREDLPAANAAFVNATLCHALDYDDTHSGAASHISTVACPSALAVGQDLGRHGQDVLVAIVAANEIVTRLGMAADGGFHARGFHPTAICGIFGSVVAAARLSDLPPETTVRALGLAGSMASGLFAYLEDGTETKPFHPGWAAHGGLIAVRLAAAGAEGPRSVFEGRFGVYHAYLGVDPRDCDLGRHVVDLGSRWETLNIAYKAYPVCHAMHGVLGAASELVAERNFAPEMIEKIVVRVPEPFVSLVLDPPGSRYSPRSAYEAKFSLQYSLAVLLSERTLDLTHFCDPLTPDLRITTLAEKIRYEVAEFASYGTSFPGGLTVTLTDGTSFTREVLDEKGGAANPWSDSEVAGKFRANAGLAADESDVIALERAILMVDSLASDSFPSHVLRQASSIESEPA